MCDVTLHSMAIYMTFFFFAFAEEITHGDCVVRLADTPK